MKRRLLATGMLALALSGFYGCNRDTQPAGQPATKTTQEQRPGVGRPPLAEQQQPAVEPSKPQATEPEPATQAPRPAAVKPEPAKQASDKPSSIPRTTPEAKPAASTARAAARAGSLDEKCGYPRPDCYQTIGPARIEKYLSEQRSYQSVRVKDCDKYGTPVNIECLYEGDRVRLHLPRTSTGQAQAGYQIRWMLGAKNVSAAERDIIRSGEITYEKLANLPAGKDGRPTFDATVGVGIFQGDKLCGSYKFNMYMQACDREQPAPPPVEEPKEPPVTRITPPPEAPPVQEVKPVPPVTQQQKQEQSVIINITPQPAPEPAKPVTPPIEVPPAKPPQEVPPPVLPPEEPQAKNWMVTPKGGFGWNTLGTTVPGRATYCPPGGCSEQTFKQRFENPVYGLGVSYTRPTFETKVEGKFAHVNLVNGVRGASASIQQGFADRAEYKSISADVKKSFTNWRIRPTANVGGSYTDLDLRRGDAERNNVLKEGYVAGGVTAGTYDKSYATVVAGVANKDVQALYTAPQVNVNRPHQVNDNMGFAKAEGRALILGNHLDLYGNFRKFLPQNVNFDGIPSRVTNMSDWATGVKWWVNPNSGLRIGPGVEYQGWRQRLNIPGYENLKNRWDTVMGQISFQF